MVINKYIVKSWYDDESIVKNDFKIEKKTLDLNESIDLAKSLVKRQDFQKAEVLFNNNLIYHISLDVVNDDFKIINNKRNIKCLELD